jgi:potassium efflux system protein
MFGINLETQPEIVQTAAGYLFQGRELAASWLLSPAAWSHFGLLVVAYLVARMVHPAVGELHPQARRNASVFAPIGKQDG